MQIDDIKNALNAIPQTSFVVNNPRGAGYSQNQANPEINFVSDLKTRLVLTTDLEAQNLLVQLELNKTIQERHFDDESFRRSREALFQCQGRIRPDLVIHEDQYNQSNQALALECKTSPRLGYEDFCKDLFKLMIYREIFAFELLVFVIANKSPEAIQNYLIRYCDDNYYLNSDNLHILVKQSADSPITCINHPDGKC